ncbi:MAG: esterase [Sphingobacteriales bacterium]|jgi:esterase
MILIVKLSFLPQLYPLSLKRMLLNHKIYGEGGTPLFILHGLLGSLDNWHTLATKWGKEFMVVAVDQRNHGKSFHTSEMNYSAMAEDLSSLMGHLNIEKANVLGHSMGGKTVMQFAVDFPHKLEKLIVADISPREYPAHHDSIFEALMAVNPAELNTRGEAEDSLAKYIPEPGTRLFLMKNLDRQSDGSFVWKMNLPVLMEKYDEVGKRIEIPIPLSNPTLFIGGGNSSYISEEDELDISDQFTNVSFETIPNAGHWLHAENPTMFYELVTNFLK